MEYKIIVIDSHSEDGSIKALEHNFKKELKSGDVIIHELDRNRGFAFAVNRALELIEKSKFYPNFYWLLNSDATVLQGSFKALLDCIQKDPGAGIAGSRLESPDGNIECSAHRFPSPTSEIWEHGADLSFSQLALKEMVSPSLRDSAEECEWVSGASCLIKREVFDDTGKMDEEYFLYFEDADFCFRAKKKGWNVWYAPASHVIHHHSASSQAYRTKHLPGYWWASRLRFFIKFYGIHGLLMADFIRLFGFLFFLWQRFLKKALTKKQEKSISYDLKFILHDLKVIFRSRTFKIKREK
jgi:GT2 family glycosyltransferase